MLRQDVSHFFCREMFGLEDQCTVLRDVAFTVLWWTVSWPDSL